MTEIKLWIAIRLTCYNTASGCLFPDHSQSQHKDSAMPQYMISYLGGDKPASPEEGQAHMAKYRA
jgi:hypothetical protein